MSVLEITDIDESLIDDPDHALDAARIARTAGEENHAIRFTRRAVELTLGPDPARGGVR